MKNQDINKPISFEGELIKRHTLLVMRKAEIVMDGKGSWNELDEINAEIKKVRDIIEGIDNFSIT